MNIIIAGDGEVGFHLAKMLASVDDHNVTVVDPHRDLLKMLEQESDIMTITGDSFSLDILEKAGIGDADLLLSVLHDEQTNLLTCIVGKRLGAKRTVARINSEELYRDERKRFYRELGVDKFVALEENASTEIVNLLRQTAATEFFNFGDQQLQLLLLRIDEQAQVVYKSMSQISTEYPNLQFRAVAIHRNSKTIIPNGDEVVLPRDLVYVVIKPESIQQLYTMIGKKHKSINSVFIVGAGRIGRRTARRLESEMNVKLIEKDKQRCYDAVEMLDSTIVIHGDATDIDMLHEEGLKQVDAFVAVTNDSETNIFACLHAKKVGVNTTIALVENINYIDIAQNVGIDTIINKKLITASYIARFTLDAKVESSKVLSGVDAEVFEFVVAPRSKVTRAPICKLHFPEGSIVGGIMRGNESYIANGKFQIKEGDRVVVFAEPYAVRKLSMFFK